jgi:asparagine synthase (glutamine-hydrolysing)
MCGIAGVSMAGGAPSDGVLEALSEALAHRGPDGRGSHLRGGVGMVHTRLAIIDLETGDQPIVERGAEPAALVANGEIYNDLELRAELKVAFATGSDCESPLHLYRRHGLDFARHLRGMYAIAIDDPANARLVLARDPFGIKPLYTVERGLYFAFASEPQALLAAGLAPRAVHARARGEMLQLQFSTGRATAHEAIERVLPGETLVVRDGRVVERRRIAALPEGAPVAMPEEEALARLDAALEDTVRCHQRADVPYGMFLSGGIDSSALLAMMARLNDRPVRAYTAAFPAAGVADERARARAVARALGAEHVEVEVGEADFWRALPRIAAAVDDACADYAVVPSYLLAQAAAREVKVVLCGEGGDEILAGYGRYRSALRPPWLGGRAMRARGTFDGLGVLREPGRAWRAGIAAAETQAGGGGRSRLQAAQATDCADWLPNDLLVKLDRCLMAHGLEGRTPFLDRAFAATAFVLPDRLKLRGRLGKWVLRRWLSRHLPESAPLARKRGFTVPVGEWIAGHAARLGPLVAAQPGIAEMCRAGAVERLFASGGKRAGFAAWTLLYYALWHRAHILGVNPDGHVFEALAATAD